MKNISIEVLNISKKYSLGKKGQSNNLLKDEIFNFFASKLKKGNKVSRNNSKTFWALKNISFTVEKGEVLGIIGPNGAGKSTLLKILSQITYPTDGEIKLHGRVASLLEVGTGFTPELTGRENIFLNGAILGMSRKEINSKVNEIIKFAGIGEFIDTPVKRYSSGMYIRLAFSVAAHLSPEILLVDEVLAVGDANFQKKSLGKMNEITKDRGRTVVFVSHDMNAIRKLCSKVVLIDKGRVVKYGSAEKVVGFYLSRVNKDVPKIGNQIDDSTVRQGTGEIIATKIILNDSKNKSVTHLKAGDNLNLKIHFKAKKGQVIKNLLVGLLFKTELGTPVFLTHNIMTGDNFSNISGEGDITLEIPNLPLTTGTYYVNYSLMKDNGLGGEYYDNIDDAFKFEVQYGKFFKTSILPQQIQGPALVKSHWKITK